MQFATSVRPDVMQIGGVGLVVSALLACAADQPIGFLRLPGSATATEVTEVQRRNGYLDASLGDQRFFFPADETCVAVISTGARVQYVESGVLGVVEGEAGRCEPVGVGSLEIWRSKKPREVTRRSTNLRAQIVYREIYRDDDVALLRGRFPLASRARLRGDDVVAVISAEEPCLEGVGSDEQLGTMEYRQAGRDPFRALLGGRQCPILGFATPLGPH
jgi:hypothetical protein